jgi:hypothetical protein
VRTPGIIKITGALNWWNIISKPCQTGLNNIQCYRNNNTVPDFKG